MNASAQAAFGEMPLAQPVNRLMITLAVMSATLIQVLDTTIVNVALPHMQGELGTTADQVSIGLSLCSGSVTRAASYELRKSSARMPASRRTPGS